jgi:hypothetical protein
MGAFSRSAYAGGAENENTPMPGVFTWVFLFVAVEFLYPIG